jgi:hypothetical protein
MSESRITPGVIYKAILLAFGLVVAAFIFQALISLMLGVLIVAIIAAPLSAFADMLQRRHVPRGDRSDARPAAWAGGDRRADRARGAGIHPRGQPFRRVVARDRRFPLPPSRSPHGVLAAHITAQVQHFVTNYTRDPSKLSISEALCTAVRTPLHSRTFLGRLSSSSIGTRITHFALDGSVIRTPPRGAPAARGCRESVPSARCSARRARRVDYAAGAGLLWRSVPGALAWLGVRGGPVQKTGLSVCGRALTQPRRPAASPA